MNLLVDLLVGAVAVGAVASLGVLAAIGALVSWRRWF